MSHLTEIEAVQKLLEGCDHFDEKTIEGKVNLREFIAGMFSYYPAWIKALYGIRWGFVRLLGMKQENLPTTPRLTPDAIPFETGAWATFFQVEVAEENRFWIASANDKHLAAYIAVSAEPLPDGSIRFHVGTIVHYRNWAGPVYFNVIRLFHHIVVSSMMQAGVRYQAEDTLRQYT